MVKPVLAVSGVVLACLLPSCRAATPGGDGWKYDVIFRREGPSLNGLVVEERASHIVFKSVMRKPGRPTLVFTELLPRKDIVRIARAAPADRAELGKRLEALAREHETLEARLRAIGGATRPETPADSVMLQPAPWIGDASQRALAYESTYFCLLADESPAVVELAAVRLEQVYAAYARAMPATVNAAQPTTIILTRSLADYQALARENGLNLRNPAFYDAGRNRVVCASDLQRLGKELETCRLHHDRLRADLHNTETDLGKAYGGLAKVPAEVLRPVLQARRDMKAVDERNEALFRKACHRLFQRLYHEAFHAYVGSFVYPPSEGELPRWLNEGLAQVFETAILELDELRVGHADKDRLDAVRSALARDTFPSVAELLKSEPRRFLVAHAADRPESDRAYLASWALAFHLTFARHLLGTPALSAYCRAVHRGVDRLAAFQDLVGMPLAQFDKEYVEFLKKLKPDGSAK